MNISPLTTNGGGTGRGRSDDGHVPRLRLSIIAVVAVALFASMFARLYDLQVLSSDDYQVQAEANRVREIQIPAPRGRILDRNGKVLVDNRVAVTVAIDRSVLGELARAEQDDVLARLSLELTQAGRPTNAEVIRASLTDQRINRYSPVPVAADVPEELKIYLEENAQAFPGVVVERTALRAYPYGPLAAHIVGYVGKINDDELAAHRDETAKPYTLNDEIGKSGVEATYESYLRGTPGLRRIEVDAEGNPIRVISERLPRAGDDLVLTLDVDVQALAEQKVQQGLADARARGVNRDGTRNNGTTGAAVVLSPNHGQIVAMASYPSYDPNIAVDGFSDAEWEWLLDPVNHFPLNNWAIQGQWAPGSSYKPFVAYAALASGLMAPDTVFSDGGGYLIPDCDGSVDPHCFRSNAGGAVYGNITIDRALTVSSDAFFFNVGAQFWMQSERLGGEEGLQQRLVPWGIGDRTGVALTGERAGRIPTPTWRREFGERIGGYTGWTTGDNVNMGIGQGDVLVTPLQLANAYATLANGGTRYVPQIALRAQAYNTDEVTAQFGPQVGAEVPLPPEIRQPLYDGLVNVPVSGTAVSAFSGFPLDVYPIAGKTGTAQVGTPEEPRADTAVFAAFGPGPDPRYAVSVFLEESGFGGVAAAPVARALFDALAGVVPLQPAGPNGLPVGGTGGLVAGSGVD
jgi:penicillin-binding protein 2